MVEPSRDSDFSLPSPFRITDNWGGRGGVPDRSVVKHKRGPKRKNKSFRYKEEQFLKKHYDDYSLSDLGKIMGRSTSAIANKAFRMGLKKTGRKRGRRRGGM